MKWLTDPARLLQELCIRYHQWGLYVIAPRPPQSSDPKVWRRWNDRYQELHGSWLPTDTEWKRFVGAGYVFGSAQEIEALYQKIHGFNGPHEADSSCTAFHAHAITCDSMGRLINENT